MKFCNRSMYFLTTWMILFVLCNGQDRIIFPDDDDEDSFQDYNSVTPVKIPDKLLIQMKDIRNADDFINRFLHNRGNSGIAGRVSNSAPRAGAAPVPVIAKPAICQPEQRVLELEKPDNGAVFLWPSCVRVLRCGGCCTSKLLTCSPTATSFVNFTVLQIRYNPQSPDTFESQGTRVFTLEQHNRCSCSCRQRPESCRALQEFREDECRCACINQDLSSQCKGPLKIWDNSDCRCKCRHIMDCSTGSYFNPVQCRCEAISRS